MREFINYYFRERQPDDANDVRAMYYPQARRAGDSLPKSIDGKVYNVIFKACDFHDSCQAVEFVNCTFIGCYNTENFKQTQGASQR